MRRVQLHVRPRTTTLSTRLTAVEAHLAARIAVADSSSDQVTLLCHVVAVLAVLVVLIALVQSEFECHRAPVCLSTREQVQQHVLPVRMESLGGHSWEQGQLDRNRERGWRRSDGSVRTSQRSHLDRDQQPRLRAAGQRDQPGSRLQWDS